MASEFPRVLIVMALEIEGQGAFEREGISVLYTGIGKVNAAIALARRVAEYKHAAMPLTLVLNFGTAGSRVFNSGAVVACTKFVQRDMDVSGLGFAPGVTPFEEIPPVLEFDACFPEFQHGVCGSGDSFATGSTEFSCDVVDMEAYALAKVCHLEKIPFGAVKYVTDGADHNAAASWQENVHRAAERFVEIYRALARRTG